MSEFGIGLLFIYMIITFVVGCFTAAQWWITHPDNDIQLLWLPNHIVAEWCEEYEINKIGHCIADIVMNILLGPATLLAIVIVSLIGLPVFMIMLFAWIFRKR